MAEPPRLRLALARSLAAAPPVLLLDEPTTGLGHALGTRVLDRIRALSPDAVMVISQHHDDVVLPHRTFAVEQLTRF